jgi:uncharacterized membrane protein
MVFHIGKNGMKGGMVMISNTEWLIISIMGIYTFIIVYGIHSYEAKLRRAENVSKNPYSNAEHYTHLQLSNDTYRKEIYALDAENKTLQMMNSNLKMENSELRAGISTGYPMASYTTGGMASGHIPLPTKIENGIGTFNLEVIPGTDKE